MRVSLLFCSVAVFVVTQFDRGKNFSRKNENKISAEKRDFLDQKEPLNTKLGTIFQEAHFHPRSLRNEQQQQLVEHVASPLTPVQDSDQLHLPNKSTNKTTIRSCENNGNQYLGL